MKIEKNITIDSIMMSILTTKLELSWIEKNAYRI